MLTHLSIQNYALIDDLQVRFPAGFVTITGETGAGKSILLEALGLVLGKRADRSALRDDSQKCIVEAEFSVVAYEGLPEFFENEDLDYEAQTLLRREIRPNGKSRAFINDSPVTLEAMASLGRRLIDVHSQHQTLELTQQEFQLRVVDALAGNGALLEAYGALREAYLRNTSRLAALESQREAAFREQDYKTFLLGELQQTELRPGMQGELEARQSELSHAELIIELLGESRQICEEETHGLLSLQARLRQLSAKLASFGPRYEALHSRVQSLYIESDDLAQEIADMSELQQADPAGLAQVNDRLQGLYDLQKKHGADSVEELLQIRARLERELDDTADLDAEITRLRDAAAAQERQLRELADRLHEQREGALPGLTARLEEKLGSLGMPDASFRWQLLPRENFGPQGSDDLELLFTANKGGAYGTLKKTASGGELSRIMLTIKSILATYESLPTMIFDEIDTGVSGEISNRMGDIMKAMGETMQVLAITHLPQVASKGGQQFRVFKEVVGERTYTRMKCLDQQERIQELAQMLGGSDLTDAALSHARQLLN